MLSLKNMIASYVCLYIMGMMTIATRYMSYVYLLDMVPRPTIKSTSTVFFTLFGLSTIFSCFYFSVISKTWDYLWYANAVISLLVGLFLLWYSPESPRLLVAQGKFNKARKALTWIAKINHKPEFD